jgi:hypothetical protein
MLIKSHSIKSLTVLTLLLFSHAHKAAGGALSGAAAATRASQNASREFAQMFTPPEPANAAIIYKWNIEDTQSPLLGLADERITPGFDQILSYPVAGFSFPMFSSLSFDEAQGRYIFPAISQVSGRMHFVEFAPTGVTNRYVSQDGTNIELIDNNDLKTFRAADGTKFIFVRYPDEEFRCATIKSAGGVTLNLLYAANGLALHGVVDSLGRSITFNQGRDGINSISQSWMANSEGLNRIWVVGNQLENNKEGVAKYAHAVAGALKSLPSNAVVHEYTAEMAASDKTLAEIFGGPQAVAGANGFEPSGLGAQYPLYRGDIIGDDGRLRTGHLSHAMHVYGSPDGKGDSALYVPAGFTSHSGEPSPTDAAVLFYYPRLGNLTDVTVAVFHVANFQITYEGNRVRIGNIGGPGGSSPFYKHSHIDFYRGNTSLPPASARAALRIDPATVFGSR